MSRHLTEDEITAAAAGLATGAEVDEHLAVCVTCNRAVEEFRHLVAERRASLEAEMPDWGAQRRRILVQLSEPGAEVVPLHRGHWRRTLLAVAAVVLAAVGVWLQFGRQAPAPAKPAVPVEKILAEVDATLADDQVPGFEALSSMVPTADEMASMMTSNGAS
jgi:bacterioferritin-associated ferredoxin